jgi:CRP/FNR family transcriptional regulator
MFELFERFPAFATTLLGEATRHTMHACDRIEQLSSGQVEQRLATLLVRLAHRVGVERPRQGVWIPVPLSRQDLADMCGTTVETIIRTMSRFRKSKLVRPATRGFLITSPAELEELARAPQRLVTLRVRRGDGGKAACG